MRNKKMEAVIGLVIALAVAGFVGYKVVASKKRRAELAKTPGVGTGGRATKPGKQVEK
jgi:hypothetical protein